MKHTPNATPKVTPNATPTPDLRPGPEPSGAKPNAGVNDAPFLSVVLPAYNEAESIPALHAEIVDVCSRNGYSSEIIIVDDGSSDDTARVVKELSPVTYVRLRRNFGQTSAMDCGIKQARGRYIVTMDADGQNDPADIPALLAHLQANELDVVSGWRRRRRDGLGKRLASRAAHAVRRRLISDGIHDSGCSLKIYRRECFKGVSLFGEMHRFIPAVLKIKGFRIGEIEVNHRPRTAGSTKYNWKRGVKGLIDMVSVWFWHKYAVRPLHLLGGLGVLSIFIGSLTAAVGIGFYIRGVSLFRYVLPIAAIFFLLTGTQLFVFGLIADMLSRNYFETTRDTPYSVRDITHVPAPADPPSTHPHTSAPPPAAARSS